ncbi:MAG: hypothetical protein H7Z14_16995 [Anaerolineae bacterium]|nr:hypothetical protein [Phycisphaerae bacterium]
MTYKSPLSLLMILLFTLVAAPVQSQNTPSTRPADDLRAWFKQLSDPSQDVRDKARIQLMTMSRARLPALKSIVAETRPLSAAQAVELQQIVEHVFLSGQEYFAEQPARAFMGVEMANVSIPEFESNDISGKAENLTLQRVMITGRLPGFAAFPVLRDGDIVLAVVGSNIQLGDRDSLPRALGGAVPGETIELDIQRAGKLMRFPIRLSRRPIALRSGSKEEKDKFVEERDEAASKYWEANFAKLLDQHTL